MARRRHIEAPPNLRAELAATYRDLARYYSTLELGPEEDPAGWTEMADAIEAGEPVVVSGWLVPAHGVDIDPNDDLRVDPDGSLTRMRCVHSGDHLRWERA